MIVTIPGHQQEVIFGVMYSLASVSLGVFVLVYFVISRSDVQQCFGAVWTFAKGHRLCEPEGGPNPDQMQTDQPVNQPPADGFGWSAGAAAAHSGSPFEFRGFLLVTTSV